MDEVRRGELRQLALNYGSAYCHGGSPSAQDAFDAIVLWVEEQTHEAVVSAAIAYAHGHVGSQIHLLDAVQAAERVMAERSRG